MTSNSQENESKYNAVFNASVDGIITINSRGIIESFNPSASQLFGYAKEELIGKSINVLMPEPDRIRHDGYIKRYEQTKEKRIIGIGREVNGLKKDGTIFPFRLAVSEVKLEKKVIYAGFIHDLTEQKKAEKELSELNTLLEQKVVARTEDLAKVIDETQKINRSLEKEVEKRKLAEIEAQRALVKELELGELKSRFVSMASHEFRTPLTGILSSIALIGKYTTKEQEEKKQKHIRRIRTSVQNLTSILDDFLSLDKLQAGKIKCNPIEFNYSSFIINFIEEAEQIKKQGQKIHFQHEEDDPSFYTDQNVLKNILINLFSNAIKYTAENKNIYVESCLKNNILTIEIRDEGIGIPKEEQQYLFERFFRARNAQNIQGTGLGLNIVKEYVHLLGGEINYSSKESSGSTFKIKLPNYYEVDKN